MAMQLNSKELKGFRNTLALWHVADFVLADELLQKQARVKALQTIIDTDNSIIEKLENGEKVNSVKTVEELKEEVTTYEKKVKEEDEQMKKLREEQTKDIKAGRELVTDALLKAFMEYSSNVYSDEKEQALLDELVKWFSSNGAKDVTVDDVKPYARAVGQKKASAKQKCKTNRHNATLSKVAMQDIFLGSICDEPTMAGILPVHKWITVIEQKTK